MNRQPTARPDHPNRAEHADTDGLDDAADDWLVTKAQEGFLDAYEVLVRRHRDRIYRIALRMLGNRQDAEDIAQDVVLQVWTALSGFAGGSSFTTWLYRIVVNRCLNHIQRRRPPGQPLLDTDGPTHHGADEHAVARARADATLAAVTALDPELRAPLVLREIEQLSYREVSKILAVSEPTVRGRLHRARRQLADTLREWS